MQQHTPEAEIAKIAVIAKIENLLFGIYMRRQGDSGGVGLLRSYPDLLKFRFILLKSRSLGVRRFCFKPDPGTSVARRQRFNSQARKGPFVLIFRPRPNPISVKRTVSLSDMEL